MTKEIEVSITNENEVFNPEAVIRFRGSSETNGATSGKHSYYSYLMPAEPSIFSDMIDTAKQSDNSYIICNKAAEGICHTYLDNIEISGLQVLYTENNYYPE